MRSILHRYIFKELLLIFIITIAFLSFIFLMTKLLEITNYIVNYKIGLLAVARLLAYGMPFFLQFIIPMSVMTAVLLTFLRMSGDKEIIALKASGVSIRTLLTPVLLFSLVGVALTAWIGMVAMPGGRRASRTLLYEMAVAHLDVGLKARQFIDDFQGVLLYVHQIDTAKKLLTDVFVEDRRSSNIASTVVAPRGRLILQPRQRVVLLQLFNGTIHQVDIKEGAANAVAFDTYNIRLDTARKLPSNHKDAKDEEEMSLAQLRRYINSFEKKNDQYHIALMEWHKKFSLPAACFVLALLGMPLGITANIARRSFGIGLGLSFFLLYYLLLSMGWAFGETGLYPPVLGMWAPNFLMLIIALFMLNRAVHEKAFPFFGTNAKRSCKNKAERALKTK